MPTLPNPQSLPKQKWCGTVCFAHFVDYFLALPATTRNFCMHASHFEDCSNTDNVIILFHKLVAVVLFLFLSIFSFLLDESYLCYNILRKINQSL